MSYELSPHFISIDLNSSIASPSKYPSSSENGWMDACIEFQPKDSLHSSFTLIARTFFFYLKCLFRFYLSLFPANTYLSAVILKIPLERLNLSTPDERAVDLPFLKHLFSQLYVLF